MTRVAPQMAATRPLDDDIQLLEVEVTVGVDPVEWPRTDDLFVVVSVENLPLPRPGRVCPDGARR